MTPAGVNRPLAVRLGLSDSPSEFEPPEVKAMSVIRVVYENGVFRPRQPVDLPDGCEVEIEPRVVALPPGRFAGVYRVLAQRFESGEPDTAARHDEHQP